MTEELDHLPPSLILAIETMPGDQHHNLPVVSTQPSRSIGQALPIQSPNRIAVPVPPSCLSPPRSSGRRQRKRSKRVYWHDSVIDNEKKARSRTKTPPTITSSSRIPMASGQPSTQPASSRVLTANTPVRMVPAVLRQPLVQIAVQCYHPTIFVGSPFSRPPTQRTTQIPANSSSKLVSPPLSQPPRATARALPPLPGLPRTYCPPPAPRPSRLPTPDLPEIDETKFFVPKAKLFDFDI